MTSPVKRRLPPSRFAVGLTIILAWYWVAGGMMVINTPIFENPDESSHLMVIHTLRRGWRFLPRVDAPKVTSGARMADSLRYSDPPQYYTPLLYHALAAWLTRRMPWDDFQARLIPSLSWEAGYAPQRNADPWNKNVYVHLPDETWAASPVVRVVWVLRGISLLCGLLTILCTAHIARLLWPSRPWLALGIAAAVAFNPQFIATMSSVSNDPLMIALFSSAFWGMLRAMRESASWQRWVMLGAWIGLGLLTKQSGWLLLALGGMAILGQGDLLAKRRWRVLLAHGLALGVTALLVGGSWYGYNWVRYHDPLGFAPHFARQVPLAGFGGREAVAAFQTYWGGFGWALLLLPGWMYGGFAALSLGAVAGWGKSLLPDGAFWRQSVFVKRALVGLTLAWGLNLISFVRWAIATGSPYGRLLFPTISATMILGGWGLAQWDLVRRRGGWLIVGALAVLAGFVPWGVVRPAFASPVVADAPRTSAQGFADGVMLLDTQAPSTDLYPGDSLKFVSVWRTSRDHPALVSAWVHLTPLDPTKRVAEDSRWLGGTLYPVRFWTREVTVAQRSQLRLPDEVAAPELYWVHLGLADAAGQAIPLADGKSDLIFGPWRVRARHRPSPPQVLLGATFGPSREVSLLGYSARLRPTMVITLSWEALSRPAADATVFVHLLDGQRMVAQHDAPPNGGAYPSSWWLPGDVILDPHPLPATEPGRWTVVVGLYDPQTGNRWPAYDAQGARLPDDCVIFPLP